MSSTKNKTVIKINNIPHGFYETQMNAYFSQFGKVNRVAVIRSSKTGKSRGFGFVQFQYHEPAKAAVDVMHNYLMFNHILKCRLLDAEKVKKVLDKYSVKGKRRKTSLQLYKQRHNKVEKRDSKYVKNHYKKIIRVQKLLEKMGIKIECRVLNAPDMSRDTDSITSGSTNSGETFSATSEGSDVYPDSDL